MSDAHRNGPPNLDPGTPEPGENAADLHPRLGGDAIERGAGGHPTSGLRGDGGGLGDAIARAELMSQTEARRGDPATPAIGTGAGRTVAGGALVHEARAKEQQAEAAPERTKDNDAKG